MKKHISVFGFYARSSTYKVLLVLLLMALAETTAFLFQFQGELENYYDLLEQVTQGNAEVAYLARPEQLLGNGYISVVFAVAVMAVSVILCLPGCEFGAKTSYTLKRLLVSERACFFWQMLCSLMLYFLVYVVQISLVFGLSQYYICHAPEELVGNQSIFLMFYRSEFLHSLLPLADIRIWVRNIFLLFGLAFAAAGFSYQQRRKKKPMALWLMLVCSWFFFSQEIAGFSNVMFLSLTSLMVITKLLFNVLPEEETLF